MSVDLLFWLVPLSSLIALGFAFYFYRKMLKEDEGTPTMREIAAHVRKGAMAYLKQQYKVVTIVFIILAIFFAVLAYGFDVQNHWVPFAFLTGGFFSGLAGFIGMKTATYASGRTANAARRSLNSGLKLAFRSGAVMGLTVVVHHSGYICQCGRPSEAGGHHHDHADLRNGCLHSGSLRPCGRRYLHQGC